MATDSSILYWDGSAYTVLPPLPDGWRTDPNAIEAAPKLVTQDARIAEREPTDVQALPPEIHVVKVGAVIP